MSISIGSRIVIALAVMFSLVTSRLIAADEVAMVSFGSFAEGTTITYTVDVAKVTEPIVAGKL